MGEPARAGRALLGAEASPGARGRSPRFAWRSLSQIGGGPWPTSLVKRGAEGALPLAPRNAADRAAGPLGCAGRIATRLLAARPPPPASLPRLPRSRRRAGVMARP